MYQVRKKLIICSISYSLFFNVMQAMILNKLCQTYPCQNIQQAFLRGNKVFTNNGKECNCTDLEIGTTETLFSYQNYQHLAMHPTKPLLALSGDKIIRVHNYKTNVSAIFDMTDKNEFSSCIYIGKFNPDDTTFFCYNRHIIHSLNCEQPSQIISYRGMVYSTTSSIGIDNNLQKPTHLHFSFFPGKNRLCIAKTIHNICTYDIGALSENTPNQKCNKEVFSPEREMYNMTPFFCEYDRQELLVIASQDAFICTEILIYHMATKTYDKIKSSEGVSFQQIALHPMRSILVTLSRPGMKIEWWDIKTGLQIAEGLFLYPHQDKEYAMHHNYFLNFSPQGNRIVVGKKGFNEYIVMDVPTQVIQKAYEYIFPYYLLGKLTGEKCNLPKDIWYLFIKKIIKLYHRPC